jgi:nucleoside-diphosphate-sugar epimerase
MRVVIAGGHGKIALLLERLLAGRGDQAVGLIRNPAHVADVQRAGAEAVVCDLEAAPADDVAVLLSGLTRRCLRPALARAAAPRARTPSTGLPPC